MVEAQVVEYDTILNTPYAVQSGDLLETGLASTSSSGNFQAFGGAGLVVLNDGGFVQAGAQFGQTAFAGANYELTYVLSDPLGYRISAINTYAGWDAFRGGQAYTVAYDTVHNPGTYIDIATVFHNPTGGGNVNSRVRITASAGDVASDVRSIRFQFDGVMFDQAGYREIDIIGVAVPEPSGTIVAASGLLVLAVGWSCKRRVRGR
jgi:hypothetical protein